MSYCVGNYFLSSISRLVGALFVTVFLGGFSVDAFADNTSVNDKEEGQYQRSERVQQHRQQIDDVLAGKDFGNTKTVKSWRFIDTDDDEVLEDKFPEWLIKIFEWLEKRGDKSSKKDSFGDFNLASILEFLLWGVVIGGLVFVLIRYREHIFTIVTSFNNKPRTEVLPTSMFGLDIKEESLPDDIVGTARDLWLEGEQRLAIATLLRASLINLLNKHQCRFYDSDTEAECCARIDKQAPQPLSHYMRSLVSAWQQIAYAHRIPSKRNFELLCNQWEETFL